MDLLTPSVNVPAERAKLRRLRNEINTEAQARLEYQRNHTARGYRRAQLPDVPELATQSQPSHGPAPAGPLRPRASMDVLPAAAPVQKAQAGCAGCGRGAGQVECAGVKA